MRKAQIQWIRPGLFGAWLSARGAIGRSWSEARLNARDAREKSALPIVSFEVEANAFRASSITLGKTIAVRNVVDLGVLHTLDIVVTILSIRAATADVIRILDDVGAARYGIGDGLSADNTLRGISILVIGINLEDIAFAGLIVEIERCSIEYACNVVTSRKRAGVNVANISGVDNSAIILSVAKRGPVRTCSDWTSDVEIRL